MKTFFQDVNYITNMAIFTFRQWLLESGDAVDFSNYDLQKKYDHYNVMLFDGKLPTIPIEFANLKGVGGVVKASVVMDPANLPNPRLVRMGLQDKYHGAKIKEGTHKMQISKLFKRSEQGLDAILIHEMIHVYFNSIGKFGESHGSAFQAMCRRLGEQVGFKIPLTDDVEKLGLTDETALKGIGVHLLTKREGTYAIALMTDKNMTAKLEAINERWKYMMQFGDTYAAKSECYIVKTLKWTELATKYPLQRREPKDLGYYSFNDPAALEDLRANGRLLSTLTAPPKQPRQDPQT